MLPNKENDLLYLLNILESLGKIRIYTADAQDPEVFYQLNEQLNFNASLNLLANIGESVSKISNDLKEEYHKINWIQIKDFRNRIVHDYMGIDLFITFEIITNDMVKLYRQINKIVKKKIAEKIFDIEELKLAADSSYYRHINFKELF